MTDTTDPVERICDAFGYLFDALDVGAGDPPGTTWEDRSHVVSAMPSERPWGVGMPAWLHLHDFADQCRLAYSLGPDESVVLVGSALRTKRPRDIDVRIELSDAHFQAEFGAMDQFGQPGSRWSAHCKAFSALGRGMTGRTIDCQTQPTAVSLCYRDDARLRLGMGGER